MKPRLKGILFDLDDTLLDWSGVKLDWRDIEAERLAGVLAYLERGEDWRGAPLESLVERYTQRTRDAWIQARRDLRAPRMPEILIRTLSEFGLADAASRADEILRAYDWQAVEGTVVFPDAPPMLSLLRAQGLKLGIVTNASQPMELRDAELREHGIIDYFPDCRVSAADVGWLKPDARIFQSALRQLGANPEEAVFVGDNPLADIEGARSVGMRAVQRVLPGDEALDDSGRASPRLSSLARLPAILDRWYPGWRRHGA